MAGLDVAIALSPRFAVVPQIRVQAADGLSLRPGVSVRVAL
jgi:hypothetical protein